MKLGLIVRANNRGLGIQSWEFYRHLKPYKTLVVVLSCDDENTISRFSEGNVTIARGQVRDNDFTFFQDCDVVLSFETFYNTRAVENAKQFNPCPRFILQPNYEQQNNAEIADGLIVPTVWNFQNWNYGKVYLPVPVDRERLPFKMRTSARVFVHNAGTQLGDDRNGTLTLLRAMPHVKSPIKLIVHIQKFNEMMYNEVVKLAADDARIELDTSTFENYWELWQRGDVFVYPRAYGGLSLPLNEAMSAGMPVLMPKMNPQNEFLPQELLIPIKELRMIKMFKPVQACTVEPKALAEKIDALYAMSDIFHLSRRMDEVARHWDWEKLLPKYKKVLEQTVWN